jgi:hypothetical protein
MQRLRAVLLIGLTMLACAVDARAQTQIQQMPLARFVTDLLTSGGLVDSTRANGLPDFLVVSQLGGTPIELNQSIALQLTTFPFDQGFDTSAPGMSGLPSHYALGNFTLHAGSIGRGKLSLTFNYQNNAFGSLDGTSLDSGRLGFVFKPPVGTDAAFGQNVLQEALSLRMQREAAVFSLVYGATDRLDVGIGIPVVRLDLEGRLDANIYRNPTPSPNRYYFDVYPGTPIQSAGCTSSSVDVPGLNRAEQPATNIVNAPYDMVELATRTVYRHCTANGVGDVIAHARYRIAPVGKSALAASFDVALPTGDADNLLGTGTTRATAAFIWSRQAGRVGPHASVGYTKSFGHTSSQFNAVLPNGTQTAQPLGLRVPDEFNFAVGADIVLLSRLTTSVNVFGRRLQDLRRFNVNNTTAAALSPSDGNVPGTLVAPDGMGADLLVGVIAAQVALTDRTLLKANVLFPAFGDGLKPKAGVGVGIGFRY